MKIEQYLEENKSTEMLQGKLKNLQIVREEQRKRANNHYKTLVSQISDKAYMMFSQPLIEACVKNGESCCRGETGYSAYAAGNDRLHY